MAPHVKLQIVEGMWRGFDFTYFFGQDLQDYQVIFACGEGLSGRRPHFPEDPVQLFSLK